MSPEVRRSLYISTDPGRDPHGFLSELNRALAQIMDALDKAYGHRDQPAFYSDPNMQGQSLEYLGVDYLRRNATSGNLQYYDPSTKTWRDVTAKELMDQLISQTASGDTRLILTDDGTDQILSTDSGDLYLKIEGADLYVQDADGNPADIHGKITPDIEDVTGSRSIGTVYENDNDTMLDVRVSVKHS